MRALAGIVLALAHASQASAATVARTTPEAAPVLAGPEVLWGRVLYERVLDDTHRLTELALQPLAGGPRRTLARFGARRDLAGPPDLDATRATWAVDRGARRPGRIVLREL